MAHEDQDPESALIALMTQRQANPQDLALRDQEHEAFSRYMLHKLGPVLGPAVVGTSVPAYSGIKAAAQAMGGMPQATPASMQEVKSGLRPLWQAGFGSMKPIIDQTFKGMVDKGAPPVIRPNPQPADLDKFTKLKMLLRGRPDRQETLGSR